MKIKKAGTILINLENQTVALVKRDGFYSFPKGHLEKGETLIECAKRETEEETQRVCYIDNEEDVSILNYTTPSGEEVECFYYLALDLGKTTRVIDSNDKEEILWVLLSQVEKTLSYDNLKELWQRSEHMIKEKIIKYQKGAIRYDTKR